MYNDDVRNKIIEIKKKQEYLQELLQMLAREAIIYYCPCESENLLAKVIMEKNEYVVIGTSEEVLNESKQYLDVNNINKIIKIIFWLKLKELSFLI